MLNDTMAANLDHWRTRPLCARYLVVLFDEFPIQMLDGEALRERTALWALGLLANGECELLGCWLTPRLGDRPWRAVFEDLKSRGVQGVRFVVCGEPAELGADLEAVFPGAVGLPSLSDLLGRCVSDVGPRNRRAVADALAAVGEAATAGVASEALNRLADGRLGAKYPTLVLQWRAAVAQLGPFYPLVPRLRRIILSGDAVVHQMHQSLRRAVDRHGRFTSDEAASLFFFCALRAAENRLGARDIHAVAVSKHNFQCLGIKNRMQAIGF